MSKRENPVAAIRNRASENRSNRQTARYQNPTENHPEIQSEMLAVRTLIQRFGLTTHHARVVCQLSGLGGAHG